MTRDPIVDEVRKVREELASRFNYDIDALFDGLERKQREGDQKTVSFPPRPRSKPRVVPFPSLHGSEESTQAPIDAGG